MKKKYVIDDPLAKILMVIAGVNIWVLTIWTFVAGSKVSTIGQSSPVTMGQFVRYLSPEQHHFNMTWGLISWGLGVSTVIIGLLDKYF